MMENNSFPPPARVWGMTSLFLSSICLSLFIVLSITLIEKKPFFFDQTVIEAVRAYSTPAMDGFMLFMTELGSSFMLGLLLIISMIWLVAKRKNLYGMLFYLITVAGGGLVNLFLKNFFERERPDLNRMIEATGYSFPSGHSMGSMTYYGFLVYLILRSNRKPLSKAGWGMFFCLVIVLIGISRIYLGVHYPSDVLAGYMAGGVWLVLCISLLEVMYLYRGRKHKLTTSIQKKTEISKDLGL